MLAISQHQDLGSLRARAIRVLQNVARKKDDYKKACELQKQYTIISDSLAERRQQDQFAKLTARYEARRKQKQVELLEKDRQIDEMELARRREELERVQLRSRQRRQAIDLLESEQEVHSLTLVRQQSELALNASSIALVRTENAKKQAELDLQSSMLARETLLRNALLGGLLLVLIISGLLLKTLYDRRRAAALSAEAAAFKARAAESDALAARAEGEKKAREAQQEFSRRLIASHEQERERISGALHDGIGQDLLIIKNRAMMALEKSSPAMSSEEHSHLRDILSVSSEAIDDVRRLSLDLRPYQIERAGLTATLRSMLQAVAESTALDMHAEIEDVDGLIAVDREIDLYRVVQEGVNNIIKHAEASTAKIHLRRMNGSLQLSITDDGRGFDVGAWKDGDVAAGLGLQGMTERVQMLGGNLNMDSAPGKGTTVLASFPVSPMAVSTDGSRVEAGT